MFDYKNKVVVITGGTSGIGLATAKSFFDSGAKVIVTARTEEAAQNAKKEYGSFFDVLKADMCKLSDIQNLQSYLQQKYQRIDVLFANAGVALFNSTETCTEEFFDKHFDTNVKGLYFTVAKLVPLMNKGSSVILNASTLAHKGVAGASIYSATKAAVRSFARSWTAEFAPSQIRFNVLSPGPIETPIHAKLGLSPDQLEGMANSIKEQVPAKRFGKVEEIAQTALFLASSQAGYICGAEIVADGGMGQI